jgi:hypothetical protein
VDHKTIVDRHSDVPNLRARAKQKRVAWDGIGDPLPFVINLVNLRRNRLKLTNRKAAPPTDCEKQPNAVQIIRAARVQ